MNKYLFRDNFVISDVLFSLHPVDNQYLKCCFGEKEMLALSPLVEEYLGRMLFDSL